MTRGNQRDVDRARAKARADKHAKGKSQLDDNAKSMNIICKVCRQAFFTTSSEIVLKQHVEAKHPKQQYADCF